MRVWYGRSLTISPSMLVGSDAVTSERPHAAGSSPSSHFHLASGGSCRSSRALWYSPSSSWPSSAMLLRYWRLRYDGASPW